MASSINASTTAGVVTTADTSGVLQLQTAGVTAISIDASQAVSFTNSPTVTGGTANGVAYLNGSKVLTTGSALTFSGTNLGLGLTTSAWGSDRVAIEMSSSSAGYLAFNNTGGFLISNNSYYNGSTNVAKVTGAGSSYQQYQGSHAWFSMASVSAGATQTFTQAMTLDASGNLLVGTTTPLDNGSTFKGPEGATAISAYRPTTNAAAGPFGVYSDIGGTATVRAYIRADGGLANYSANNVNLSDERLKKDIALAGNYLDKICAIPVKNFRYKDQSESEDITLGVIAQDVLAIAPELVSQDGFGVNDENQQDYLSIYQTDLQYALMKCIQEQQALITQLTARITALESA